MVERMEVDVNLTPEIIRHNEHFFVKILLTRKYRGLSIDAEGVTTLVGEVGESSTYLLMLPFQVLVQPSTVRAHHLAFKICQYTNLHAEICHFVATSIGLSTGVETRNGSLGSCIVRAEIQIVIELVEEEERLMMILNQLRNNGEVGVSRSLSKSTLDKLKNERFCMEEGSSSELSDNCVVCLDEFSGGVELIRLPCSHVFHDECILSWLKDQNSCPLCRCQISD